MKYIDAEGLLKEIKRLERAANKSALDCADSETRKFHEGKALAYQFADILIDSLQQEQPIQVNTLTWKDINDLERIINNVHYEFRAGIGEKSFGEEVLERFREERDEIIDIRSPKFNVGDKICSKDGQYYDEVIKVNPDGSYKLKILGELFLPEEEWKLLYERNDGFELIECGGKEQPEVDLEKQLNRYLRGEFKQTAVGDFNDYIQIARHFYELGLSAKKEEE